MIFHPGFLLIALSLKAPSVSIDFKLLEIKSSRRIESHIYTRNFYIQYEVSNHSSERVLFNPNSIFLYQPNPTDESDVYTTYGFSPFIVLESENLDEKPDYDEMVNFKYKDLEPFLRCDTIEIFPKTTYKDTLNILGCFFDWWNYEFRKKTLLIRKISPKEKASIKVQLSYYPPYNCEACFQGPIQSKIKTFIFR